MIRIPRFKSHFRVCTVAPDLVFFIHESGYRVIRGRLLCLIAPLIDGKRSVSRIANLTKGKATSADVQCGILLLEAEGYLATKEQTLSPHLLQFYDGLNGDPELLAKSLQNKSIDFVSYGDFPVSKFKSTLSNLGLHTSANSEFSVVFVDDYLRPELEEFNRNAIRSRKPWLIVKPVGTVLWIGPLFFSPRTACWRCLAERLKEKRRVEIFLKQHGEKVTKPDASSILVPVFETALNLAALECLKWFTGSRKEAADTLLTLDVLNSKMEKHVVIKHPDCIDCGDTNPKFPTPILLNSRKTKDHASVSTESILQKYEHHISFRTGIVDEMTVHSQGMIHSVAADHLFVMNLSKKDLMQKGLTHKSWGKGTTLEEAKTGALCEALERYSGMFRGNEFRITKTYQEIRDIAIPVNSCTNFSEQQYENRDKWNQSHSNHDWIPLPLDPRREIEWTPVWSLTDKIFKYLPTAYCYYGYQLPADHYFCRADSNGNAAGSTLEDAILNGFLELVERDSAALWWYNRAQRPSVNLESFDQRYVDELRNSYSSLGLQLWVLDITTDFEIPCFAALSAPKGNARPEFLLGLGAHFDPLIALTRALTEMNQLMAIRLNGRSSKSKSRKIPDKPYLRPNPELTPKAFENFRRVNGDVKTCIKLAKHRGMEVLVLDQTRPDVGLPVAKTIVPGLRQIWPRFARGRLYDVPVQLGWVPKPLREDQLNKSRFLI